MAKFLKEISLKYPIEDPFKIIENNGVAMSPSLLPGHIYALGIDPGFQVSPDVIPYDKQEYEENIGESLNITKKPYYDTMPIGIALNLNNENYQSILNLKLMDPKYRRLILESYYALMNVKNNFISPYVSNDLKTIEVTIDKRMRNQQYMQPFFAVTESFMNNIVKANVNFAIKNYRINNIKKVRLLDWNTLPSIYNMGITSNGMVFNQRIGGLEGIFERFESKFF
jgi:hypothetical protein